MTSTHPDSRPQPMRRALMQLGMGGLLLHFAPLAHAQMSLSMAINRSARFRALSQRCAKSYAQIVLDVLPDNARDTLAASQRLIQVGFDDLAKGAFPGSVTQQISLVQQDSSALMKLLAGAPSRQGALVVSQQADRMLASAQKATESIEALSKQPSARLMNVAGRQRMLSQRLAKNYFLIAIGGESKPQRDQIGHDRAEFTEAMGVLGRAPISTEAIRGELGLAQSQWVLFEAALARKPDVNGLTTVATTNERLLEVMNNLASLYETALKDLLGSA